MSRAVRLRLERICHCIPGTPSSHVRDLDRIQEVRFGTVLLRLCSFRRA